MAIPKLSITLLIICALGHGHAQERPRVDFALAASDVTIRSLDIASTYANLHNPCGCFHEVNPLAPSGRNLATLTMFQMGWATFDIASSRFLERHHHRLLGRLFLAGEIASEAYAVQHNLRETPSVRPVAAVSTTGIVVRPLEEGAR